MSSSLVSRRAAAISPRLRQHPRSSTWTTLRHRSTSIAPPNPVPLGKSRYVTDETASAVSSSLRCLHPTPSGDGFKGVKRIALVGRAPLSARCSSLNIRQTDIAKCELLVYQWAPKYLGPFRQEISIAIFDCHFGRPARKSKIAIENGNQNLLTERALVRAESYFTFYSLSALFKDWLELRHERISGNAL